MHGCDEYYSGLKQYFFDEKLKEHGYKKVTDNHYVKLIAVGCDGIYHFSIVMSNLEKHTFKFTKEELLDMKPLKDSCTEAILQFFKEYTGLETHELKDGDIIRCGTTTGMVAADFPRPLSLVTSAGRLRLDVLPNKIVYLGNIYDLENGVEKWI